MIASLQGRVTAVGAGAIVVDLNGVGLRVLAPTSCVTVAQVGEPIAIHTHLHVRENELTLYGFNSTEDLLLFQQLLSVSGVGPKVALSVLSSMSPAALYECISQEQPEVLARVPGIGKRTAEKIIFDLRGKIPSEVGSDSVTRLTDADAQVVDALTGLGYSITESQRAVQSVPTEIEEIEERLRIALAFFVTP